MEIAPLGILETVRLVLISMNARRKKGVITHVLTLLVHSSVLVCLVMTCRMMVQAVWVSSTLAGDLLERGVGYLLACVAVAVFQLFHLVVV